MLAADVPQLSGLTSKLPQREASLVRWTHGLINRVVMGIDALLLLASTFGFWIASPSERRPLTWLQAGAVALIILIGFHIVMRSTRSYRVERYGRMHRSLIDVCAALAVAVIPAIIIIAAFLPVLTTHWRWLMGWLGAIFVGAILGRQLARVLVYIVQKCALLRRRVVVVGAGSTSYEIIRRLREPAVAKDYQLLGVIDPLTNSLHPDQTPVTGSSTISVDLTRYAQNYAVDLVIIALPWERSADIFALTRRLQWIAADVVVPFEAAGLRPQFAPSMPFTGAPILQLMHRPFKGTQGLFKVAEDYVVATIGLIVMSPILLVAAIMLLVEGAGPILFRQPRVGFNSKLFMMCKFRTMTVDPTDDGSRGTERTNQRITWVGRILRRTSIDELPQLFNVLRGEMSIVGPRPHVSNMIVGEGVYSEVVQQYAARHRIKPGITGWAQINGMRGGIDSLEKAARGAELDLYYVANWSPQFDLQIIIRTILTGLIGRDVF
jgi:exopolysaccharide biosynthesis polyprenyl glycosylphosphotransferase